MEKTELFKNILLNLEDVQTRKVLFEKLNKKIINYEDSLCYNTAVKIYTVMSSVKNVDFSLRGCVTSFKNVEEKNDIKDFTEKDYESIYDMFA